MTEAVFIHPPTIPERQTVMTCVILRTKLPSLYWARHLDYEPTNNRELHKQKPNLKVH